MCKLIPFSVNDRQLGFLGLHLWSPNEWNSKCTWFSRFRWTTRLLWYIVIDLQRAAVSGGRISIHSRGTSEFCWMTMEYRDPHHRTNLLTCRITVRTLFLVTFVDNLTKVMYFQRKFLSLSRRAPTSDDQGPSTRFSQRYPTRRRCVIRPHNIPSEVPCDSPRRAVKRADH